ncbi:DUF1656 domain-containing protein [Microbulbifer sp. 2304DJ12-6]|uniref:DUF1656 domain-containing protein n=1 Tax=Microbulbifer sp. 2304DJ12-6 TaxID=3233340 RepID=UPI00345093BA
MLVVPHELSIGEIYFSPLLMSSLLGIAAALLTARLLDRYRISRYFANPPAVIIAVSIIYTILIGTFFVGI